MAEPTLDDAIRVVTDPANRAFGREVAGMVEMRPPAIIGELQGMGASEERATELVREALAQLGGDWTIDTVRSQASGTGMWGGHQRAPRIRVPAVKLRDMA